MPNLQLSEEDYEMMIYAISLAAGYALQEDCLELALKLANLANTIAKSHRFPYAH